VGIWNKTLFARLLFLLGEIFLGTGIIMLLGCPGFVSVGIITISSGLTCFSGIFHCSVVLMLKKHHV
jgi:hypothetical protein